jgi:hypothetical protein
MATSPRGSFLLLGKQQVVVLRSVILYSAAYRHTFHPAV